MPSIGTEPFRGLAKIHLDGADGDRYYTVSIDDVDPITAAADQTTWEASPGGSLTLRFEWATTGGPLFSQADTVEVEVRTTDNVQIGTTVWTPPISGDSGVETQVMHFDDDPLDGVLGAARCGMLRLFVRVADTQGATTWNVTSDGVISNPPAAVTHNHADGYIRSGIRLASHSKSNVALGGAEPGVWAYPDPWFGQFTLQEPSYQDMEAGSTLEIHESGVAIHRNISQDGIPVGDVFSFSGDSAAERVDADFPAGQNQMLWVFRTSAAAFGGDTRFVWEDPSTFTDTGWTASGERAIFRAIQVNPDVTIQNEVLDNVSTSVFNRGETQGGDLEVANARAELFTPLGSDRLGVLDGGTEEEVVDTVGRTGTTVNWDLTFNTAGNTAPADAVGSAKTLRWSDTGAANSPTDDSGQIGLLSSLYDIAVHMQINVNTLDPSLNRDTRQNSDLGFYSIKTSNQRGQGVNGVSVTDHLRDDDDLVSAIDRTDTTATQNGNDGYLPLKAWDSQLPVGGWDHWTDAGTHNGNTFEKARSGADSFDYSLLSRNPHFAVICGGGVADEDDDGDHWHPGEPLLVGVTLYDIRDEVQVAADDDTTNDAGGQANPRAFMILARFDTSNGKAQFFDSDLTWKNVEDNTGAVYEWQLLSAFRTQELAGVPTPTGDTKTYIKQFSAADTEGWGEAGLFFVPIIYNGGTPYSVFGVGTVTAATANAHDEYSTDSVGLALHGILSQR